MSKNKETYEKVLGMFREKANLLWSDAEFGKGGRHFTNVKRGYETARKAQEKADRM